MSVEEFIDGREVRAIAREVYASGRANVQRRESARYGG